MNIQDLTELAIDLAQKAEHSAKASAADFNAWFAKYTPIEIIFFTVVTLYVLNKINELYDHIRRTGFIASVFKVLIKLPIVRTKVAQEGQKLVAEYQGKYKSARPDTFRELPKHGLPEEQILQRFKQGELAHRKYWIDGGRCSGTVYHAGADHWNFINEAMKMYIVSNPLHGDEFASVTQMESEIIRMVLNLYNGDFNTCGCCTSGGTESILLAILAYREQAKAERGVTRPNMVMSHTAHAAFDKAAFYFGVELRKVPRNNDLTCDVRAIKKQIDRNTICLVASAPEYAMGNYDPVPVIATIAKSWGIGCHVDACLGSISNAFIEEAGFKLPCQVDFRVPGVTSISCDPHKYANGPKGLSVIMFREQKLRDYQFFATMKWPGGFYATPSMAGSRPGNVIAGTWAAMMKGGKSTYLQNTKEIITACDNIKKAIESEIPEVKVATFHNSSIVAIRNREGHPANINCIALGDIMAKQFNWHLSKVCDPVGLHISIHMATCKDWRNLIECFKKAIQVMKDKPELNHSSTVATYGLAAKVPDGAFLGDLCKIHTAALLDTL